MNNLETNKFYKITYISPNTGKAKNEAKMKLIKKLKFFMIFESEEGWKECFKYGDPHVRVEKIK